ncbi:cobyric acid synthase [Desulfopila sp. IMCC35008]|uniref:cobyric acid synthase n=1 Tax=Desulfopila sp. IMCC35008 TaxID=2653858 RepID=UPI0013D67A54|nr:cobyric acid synthase [Desulfopila sp. IMCC35008]
MKIPGRNNTGHGGNIHGVIKEIGCRYEDLLDFSANINPIGPPEWLRPLISRELDRVLHYPDPYYEELVTSISKKYHVSPKQVVPANGSTDILYLLPRVLPCKRAVIPVPSYIDYERAVRLSGLDIEFVVLAEENEFALDTELLEETILPGDLVILATPNNPTGNLVSSRAIMELATAHSDSWFLIDEAFLDFVPQQQSVGGRLENIITMNSMTKFYGIPGLRLGFGIFPTEIAAKVKEHLPPWTINSLAQTFGSRALADIDYEEETCQAVSRLRYDLYHELSQFTQLHVYEGAANYLFVKIISRYSAPELAVKLLHKKILIRCCDNYRGLDDTYFRIAVRSHRENDRLVEALQAVLEPGKPRSKRQNKKCPALMFQGTSSNAGKSVLSAAFCRILLQDGVNVAPFKAQNMSLNSFVTLNGEEMGRAQVVQAQAAKLDPDVRMNPVLLKPNSDTGSQIIVKGHPVGNMSVLDYDKYKPKAWEAVVECYDSLAYEYDTIILEGAGSPGEVNLKKDDIVNMRMAAYADSPVLLVGDIDRGGVYASFVGTMEVLSEWERQLIAGFLVNRFRGQQSLLESAHDYVWSHTGRRTFGVVPYLSELGLPEEDSVSFKSGIFNRRAELEDNVDIVLVNFPHISNFTDVEPFLTEPDVSLRVVDNVEDIGEPDAILLPGSKNVIGDLHFLIDKGFSDVLQKRGENGCEIVGICGGYQMLGHEISDPLGIESDRKTLPAMGILNISTELKATKRLTRQQGVHLESGLVVFGYEIHHGVSASDMKDCLRFDDGKCCGSRSERHYIWGSYLHGIFDSDPFRRWFIDRLRQRKGLSPLNRIVAPYDLEASFDRLAETVRGSVDMDAIYSLLKL